jgi:hypothetical protein
MKWKFWENEGQKKEESNSTTIPPEFFAEQKDELVESSLENLTGDEATYVRLWTKVFENMQMRLQKVLRSGVRLEEINPPFPINSYLRSNPFNREAIGAWFGYMDSIDKTPKADQSENTAPAGPDPLTELEEKLGGTKCAELQTLMIQEGAIKRAQGEVVTDGEA